MIFDEANDWKTRYGDLISVSPSGITPLFNLLNQLTVLS